jgi:hypothetical protein
MGENTNVTVIPQLRQVFYAAYADLPISGIKAGDLGYATDRKVFYRWSGSAWESLTIYSGFGTAAAIPAAVNLPEGSLYYETNTTLTKQVQSGAWVVIITTVGLAKVTSGSYTGNDTANRTIAHGLGVAPKIVLLIDNNAQPFLFRIIAGYAYIFCIPSATLYALKAEVSAVAALDVTNFYVGNATSYPFSANASGITYYWVAIG